MLLGGAAGVAQALAVLVSPALTRLYRPEDFGEYGAAMALVSMLAPFGVLRYEQGLMLARSSRSLSAVLGACAVVGLLVVAVMSVVLMATRDAIAELLSSPALASSMWLVCVAIASAVVLVVAATVAIRQRAFSEMATMKVAQGVGLASGQLLGGLVGSGGIGLLIADIVGRAGPTLRLFARLARLEQLKIRRPRRRDVMWALARYRRFPIYSGPSVLLSALALHGPTVVLLALYGPTVGGLYFFVQRLGGVPVSLIGSAVISAYLGEAVRHRSSPSAIIGLFVHTVRRLAVLAAVTLVIVIPLVPASVPVIFGQPWADAGVFLALLAPMFAAQLVAWPTGDTLEIIERQDLRLVREVGRLALLMSGLVIVLITDASPTGAIAALSVTGTLGYALYALVSWRALRGHARSRMTVATSSDA